MTCTGAAVLVDVPGDAIIHTVWSPPIYGMMSFPNIDVTASRSYSKGAVTPVKDWDLPGPTIFLRPAAKIFIRPDPLLLEPTIHLERFPRVIIIRRHLAHLLSSSSLL